MKTSKRKRTIQSFVADSEIENARDKVFTYGIAALDTRNAAKQFDHVFWDWIGRLNLVKLPDLVWKSNCCVPEMTQQNRKSFQQYNFFCLLSWSQRKKEKKGMKERDSERGRERNSQLTTGPLQDDKRNSAGHFTQTRAQRLQRCTFGGTTWKHRSMNCLTYRKLQDNPLMKSYVSSELLLSICMMTWIWRRKFWKCSTCSLPKSKGPNLINFTDHLNEHCFVEHLQCLNVF